MEVRFALSDSKPTKTQRELLEAVQASIIHTFGWPLGIVLNNRDEYRPRPTTDGIKAEVALIEPNIKDRPTYDYWTLKRNGDFYLLQSLFEDERHEPGRYLFINTQVVKVTEALLYCVRLYSNLGVPGTAVVNIGIHWGGLKGRVLSAAGGRRQMHTARENRTEEEADGEIQVPLTRIEGELVKLVKDLTQPMFMLFDFFELTDGVYEDIVNRFVKGEVS